MCVQAQHKHKRSTTRFRRLFFSAVAACAFSVDSHSDETDSDIRLTSGHWPPYMENTPPELGVIPQAVTLAFGKQDISVTYGFFPWSRALMLAEQGLWDGSVAWTCRPAMLGQFYFSDPIVAHNYVLFHREHMDFDWEKLEDLENYRLGLTQDYNYGKEFEEAVASGAISADKTTSDETNFRKLAAGRIDLFPMEQAVGMEMLRRLELEDRISFHARPLQSDYLYLILSRRLPESEQFLRQFNEGLDELRESGRLEELLANSLPYLPASYLTVEDEKSRCRE